jgi:hypothetical protein
MSIASGRWRVLCATRPGSVRPIALLMVASVCLLLSGCGGHPAKAADQASKPEARRAVPTTTVPRATPLDMAQGACRAFTSFRGLVQAGGLASAEATGEVEGMVEQAQAAHSGDAKDASVGKLLSDLQALESLSSSKQWKAAPTETAAPSFAAVTADCQAFPTS